MSINSLACIQSISSKCNSTGPPPPPAVIQTMTSIYFDNPFFYMGGDSGTLVNNASGKLIAFRQTVTNQISPWTFKNGIYYVKNSETTSTVNTGVYAWDLYTQFCGDRNGIADTPWQSPATYNNTGSYTGSISTLTSGVTVYGEWIQIQLPWKLYLTSYQLHSASSIGGANWNNFFTKSFYICGSNDGVNWVTLDNRTNVTTNTNGFNYFTVPTFISTGYYYFRVIGTQVGALSNGYGNRMAVMLGFGGTYRG